MMRSILALEMPIKLKHSKIILPVKEMSYSVSLKKHHFLSTSIVNISSSQVVRA